MSMWRSPMKDGNKESIKELLSAIRTVVGIALSTLLVAIGLKARAEFPIGDGFFYTSLALLGLSVISGIYFFLLAILKIYHEEDEIIYLRDIRIVSLATIATFIGGNLVLGCGLLF